MLAGRDFVAQGAPALPRNETTPLAAALRRQNHASGNAAAPPAQLA
jgi:hypothetical protein